MAEDPATWGPVERVIDEAMDQAHRRNLAGMIGLSNVRLIADALRDHGLIDLEAEKAQKEWENG